MFTTARACECVYDHGVVVNIFDRNLRGLRQESYLLLYVIFSSQDDGRQENGMPASNICLLNCSESALNLYILYICLIYLWMNV